MVPNPRCQRCWNHRPRVRRTCAICLRRVGAGCWPEQCLMIDSCEGDGRPDICRDCWPAYGPAPVSRDFMRSGSSCNVRAFRFGNKSISVDIALVQAVYGTLTLSLPPCQFFIVLILTLSSLSRPPCTDNVNLDRGHHINECLLRTS